MAFDQALANDVKLSLARGQEIPTAELGRYLAMVNDEIRGAVADAAPPPLGVLSDQDAHGIYQRASGDPGSVTDEQAAQFKRWQAAQMRRPDPRHAPTATPAAGATLQERQAYLEAVTAQGGDPDPDVAAAFLADVTKANATATAERLAQFPPGMFAREPLPDSDGDQLRERLAALWQHAERGMDPAEFDRQGTALLTEINSQIAAAAEGQRAAPLPWMLDTPQDPGVDPAAVQALQEPAPWTPRQPSETEQTLSDLDALDQEAAALEGDDAA